MARHRVGNSYLSDQELAKHQENQWMVFLFVIGLIGFGYITLEYLLPLLPYATPKWIKISILVVGSCLGGGLLVYLIKFIKVILGLALIGAVGFGVYVFLYNLV